MASGLAAFASSPRGRSASTTRPGDFGGDHAAGQPFADPRATSIDVACGRVLGKGAIGELNLDVGGGGGAHQNSLKNRESSDTRIPTASVHAGKNDGPASQASIPNRKEAKTLGK